MGQKGHIMVQKGLKMHKKRQKIEFLDLKRRFFSLAELGGTPTPPLTENQCEKKKVFFLSGIGGYPPTLGQHWLLKQFCLNHPVEHIQKPKLPKLYVKVETSTTYFIIHNQFVKNCSLSDQLFCSIFLQSPSRQQSYQIMDCK